MSETYGEVCPNCHNQVVSHSLYKDGKCPVVVITMPREMASETCPTCGSDDPRVRLPIVYRAAGYAHDDDLAEYERCDNAAFHDRPEQPCRRFVVPWDEQQGFHPETDKADSVARCEVCGVAWIAHHPRQSEPNPGKTHFVVDGCEGGHRGERPSAALDEKPAWLSTQDESVHICLRCGCLVSTAFADRHDKTCKEPR